MRVLFIGHYRQRSGIGQSCRDYIRALSTQCEVIARPFLLNGPMVDPGEDIVKLEQNTGEFDYCIQYILPHHYAYVNCKKCVGLFCYECENISSSGWDDYLDLMDEIWTPSQGGLEQLPLVNGKSIPHPVNLLKAPNCRELRIPEVMDGKFNFLFVGELNVRKNIGTLVRCFNTEFHPDENVRLILKTSKPGFSAEACYQHLTGFLNEVKRGLKLPDCHPEVIITQDISDHMMMALHQSSNCFVTASHGEGVCLPALDSLSVGVPVVGAEFGGLRDIVTYPVNYTLGPCNGMFDSFPNLYTSKELWANIDEYDLMKQMRRAYNDNGKFRSECLQEIANRGYNTIGKIMVDTLKDGT